RTPFLESRYALSNTEINKGIDSPSDVFVNDPLVIATDEQSVFASPGFFRLLDNGILQWQSRNLYPLQIMRCISNSCLGFVEKHFIFFNEFRCEVAVART